MDFSLLFRGFMSGNVSLHSACQRCLEIYEWSSFTKLRRYGDPMASRIHSAIRIRICIPILSLGAYVINRHPYMSRPQITCANNPKFKPEPWRCCDDQASLIAYSHKTRTVPLLQNVSNLFVFSKDSFWATINAQCKINNRLMKRLAWFLSFVQISLFATVCNSIFFQVIVSFP